MRANSLLAPALAVTLLVPACTESPENPAPLPGPERVQLDATLSPEEQAQQMEDALNAGKIVTGATVMVEYDIPLWPCLLRQHPDAAALMDPIKVGNDAYLYTLNKSDQDGLDVHVLRHDGQLKPGRPDSGKTPETPHEATNENLSAVYSEYPTDQGRDRYYTVSRNQKPGRNYNKNTRTAGQIAWYAGKEITFPQCDAATKALFRD